MSQGLKCHLHRVLRHGLSQSILPNGFSFHLQDPRIVVRSLIPLMVSDGDFSVSTSRSICLNRFIVDGHAVYRDCIQFHLVRQPLIIMRCHTGRLQVALCQVGILPHWVYRTGELTVIGKCRSKRSTSHTEHIGKFPGRQSILSHGIHRLRCVLCPSLHLLRSVGLLVLPLPTIKE